LFDSDSIDKTASSLSRRAISIFKYQKVEPLIFLRTEYSTENVLLKQIPEIHIAYQNDGRKYIKTPTGTCGLRKFVDMDIQWLGKEILNKQELTKQDIEMVQLVFIQDALNRFDGDNLLVTENRTLLSTAANFQRKLSTPLNIVTADEAAEILDLIFKYNSIYYMSPYLSTSKHNWYWLSFRSKIPNYQPDISRFKNNQSLRDLFRSSILDAFSQRFCFLLMSLDEMGFRHYSHVNNDSMEDTTYHFNYFILLITGIFDSLAIHTKNQYHLLENEQINPSMISLRSKNGKKLLQALEPKNAALKKHIQDNQDLINAPYYLRELIAHRESLHPQHFNLDGTSVNFLFVTDDFAECLIRLGDDQENGGCSKFGIYSHSFLSPYIFAKSITSLLTNFCTKFLQLLGYNNLPLQKQIEEKSFNSEISFQDNLGF
jgi:hypothetical protein